MRTVCLLRCSTRHQDLEFAAQRASVGDWCKRTGVEIAPEDYREEPATSGAKRVRPVLERIIAEAERGEVGRIVFADFDRAGRSGARTVAMVEDLVQYVGVEVVFVREGWTFNAEMAEEEDRSDAISFDEMVVMLGRSIGGIAKLYAGSLATSAACIEKNGVSVSARSGAAWGRPQTQLSPADLEAARARIEAGETLTKVAASLRGHTVRTEKVDGVEREVRVDGLPISVRILKRRLNGSTS